MNSLSDRQIKILKAIIDEYIATALPVGSNTIERKYNLGVSPATIRNEMVKLTEEGYLKKSHSSSGRSPTPAALKFYVSNLMKEQQLSLTEEVAVKEKVWDHRDELDKFLREMTKELALRTKELALSMTEEGDIYTAGMANILEFPEFFDIDLTKSLLAHLDDADYWKGLLNHSPEESQVGILIGDDLGDELYESCGFVFRRFEAGPHTGVIGVVGPARLNYSRIYPTVRYFGELIDEIFRSW
jgi:heat-inducible transcriptional repressor